MATTFCANHLRMFGVALSQIFSKKKRNPDAVVRVATHGLMMGCFIIGALTAAALCLWLGVRAIWVALIPLIILAAELLWADLVTEKDMVKEST